MCVDLTIKVDVGTTYITYVCEFGRNFFNPIINNGLLFPCGVLYGVRFIFSVARALDNEGFNFSVHVVFKISFMTIIHNYMAFGSCFNLQE